MIGSLKEEEEDNISIKEFQLLQFEYCIKRKLVCLCARM